MVPNRYIGSFILVFIFCLTGFSSFAQLGFSFDLPKPKQYEERVLRSEKPQKKFTVPRRFIQNTTTHYNYFFNADLKINEIITRAKEAHKDDYTQLLSFYNYDLDDTQKDSIQLDSVIYKATSGIVLHDLRSDWADNMYLLWGAAHYLKKQFDSAYLTFQFINYAFAPKEKDGYYVFIGSARDGNNAMSISTKEKNSLTKKIFTKPPSRNDAFIWQIRTYLAQDAFPEAASLIVTLRDDPAFPKRLNNDLEEVTALYFYKQNMWDSAALHLSNALSNAKNKNERGRWEYLIGQMYEMSGHYADAQTYYEKSIVHTVDPVLAIYARLNSIRVNKSGGDNYIDKNIDELLKMAKRDRYTDYRDIIYFMAAQMELERNNIGAAQKLLEKAAKYSTNGPAQRNRAYFKLAELAWSNKDYKSAASFYDSLKLDDPEILKDTALINSRKSILEKLVLQTGILSRQDSLLRLAAMPEDERKEFVKKLVKEMRKEQGLKDDDNSPLGGGGFIPQNDNIFNTGSKGEWYFYNTSIRAKGFSDFKARWGKRPNVDNWRRLQAVATQASPTGRPGDNSLLSGRGDPKKQNDPQQPGEITYDALYSNLPLSDEQKKVSNDSIQNAMFELGKIYADEMEDCGLTIKTYEDLIDRYPSFEKMDEVLFHLYYCHNKNGNASKAQEIKSIMSSRYPNSRFTTIVTTGKDPQAAAGPSPADKAYSDIYDMFIEGRFDEAIAAKKIADSLYGDGHWGAQLLYIEAVYYIKQQNDSTAIATLKKIQSKYPASPLSSKAGTMIDVLGRRAQIEDELRKLQIERPQEEVRQRRDTIAIAPPKPDSALTKNNQSQPQTQPQTKTDNKPITNNTKIDSVSSKPNIGGTAFRFDANSPHYVMIILNKVDVVFRNETKNAFFRYNRDKFYNKTFEVTTHDLDAENKIVLIKPFDNAQAAVDYALAAKKIAASEIIPWLKAEKYSFSVITEQNLNILKANPDIANYKAFVEQNLPGKF